MMEDYPANSSLSSEINAAYFHLLHDVHDPRKESSLFLFPTPWLCLHKVTYAATQLLDHLFHVPEEVCL